MRELINLFLIERRYMTYFLLFMVIFIIGGACNFLVVTSNSGKMPVLSEYDLLTSRHFTFTEENEVNYWFLSDVFRINIVYFSLGDILVFLSLIGGSVFSFKLSKINKKIKILMKDVK